MAVEVRPVCTFFIYFRSMQEVMCMLVSSFAQCLRCNRLFNAFSFLCINHNIVQVLLQSFSKDLVGDHSLLNEFPGLDTVKQTNSDVLENRNGWQLTKESHILNCVINSTVTTKNTANVPKLVPYSLELRPPLFADQIQLLVWGGGGGYN